MLCLLNIIMYCNPFFGMNVVAKMMRYLPKHRSAFLDSFRCCNHNLVRGSVGIPV
jgi:hypothetical protein